MRQGYDGGGMIQVTCNVSLEAPESHLTAHQLKEGQQVLTSSMIAYLHIGNLLCIYCPSATTGLLP